MTPVRYDDQMLLGSALIRRALRLVGAMKRLGFATPTGMNVVADVWRGFTPVPDTSWGELSSLTAQTTQRLDDEGAVTDEAGESEVRLLLDAWTFPLADTDLGMAEVEIEALRQRQSQWSP